MRLRKWQDTRYARCRAKHGDEALAEYRTLVLAFAAANGLPHPGNYEGVALSSCAVGHPDSFFLDFLEALVVRFCQNFGSRNPFRPGARAIMETDGWRTKKIGQWSEKLDRCSLLQWNNILRHGVPRGCVSTWPPAPTYNARSPTWLAVDPKDLTLSVVVACSLGSSVAASRVLGFQECLLIQQRLAGLRQFDFKFGYPRALRCFGLPGPPFFADKVKFWDC